MHLTTNAAFASPRKPRTNKFKKPLIIRPRFVGSLSQVQPHEKKHGSFFQTPCGTVWVWNQAREGDAEMSGIGGWFSKILGAATPFAAMIPGVGTVVAAGMGAASTLLQPGASSVAKGLAGINSYGDSVMSALNQIAGQTAAVANGQTTAASLISEAERLEKSLSDPSRVYQPKKGKDAAALANFKSQAAAKLNEIRTAATAAEQRAAQIQQAQAQQTQQAQQAQAAASGGITIDSTTLLVAGGLGLGAILLLRR